MNAGVVIFFIITWFVSPVICVCLLIAHCCYLAGKKREAEEEVARHEKERGYYPNGETIEPPSNGPSGWHLPIYLTDEQKAEINRRQEENRRLVQKMRQLIW